MDGIEMRVTKRNGYLEDISFDKILTRVKKLGQEANIQINYSSLVMKVITSCMIRFLQQRLMN